MAATSDGYLFYRTAAGSDLTTQPAALASGVTGAGSTLITVRNALSHINVQKIRAIPTTFGVGSLTFTETDATGAIVGVIQQPAADVTGAGDQAVYVDFGPKGYKMAVGKSLFMVRSSATGPGANLIIEAYGTASTGPLAIAVTN